VVREFSTLCKTQCCTVLSHSTTVPYPEPDEFIPLPHIQVRKWERYWTLKSKVHASLNQRCTHPRCQDAKVAVLYRGPWYLWILGMERCLCHPFGIQNFEVAPLIFWKSVHYCPKPLMLCIRVCFLHDSLPVYVIALTLSNLTNSRPWVFIASVRCLCTKFSKTK